MVLQFSEKFSRYNAIERSTEINVKHINIATAIGLCSLLG